MKKLVVLLMVLLLATPVLAARNLVWDDPNPDSMGVFEYQAEFMNSNNQIVANPVVPKGQWIEVTVPQGTYTVTVI
jgi:hypothetical protein